MLGQRRRRWISIDSTLGRYFLFARRRHTTSLQRHYRLSVFFLLRTRLVVGVARVGPPLIYYRCVNITIGRFHDNVYHNVSIIMIANYILLF